MIIDRVESIIKAPLESAGYSVVRVRYSGSLKRKTLQIMIENSKGDPISINDCENVNKIISTLFIVDDPINEPYNLEISSAGIDRPLVKKEDFTRFIGSEIRIKTKYKVNDSHKMRGILNNIEDDTIFLKIKDGEELKIDMHNILDAKLDIEKNLFNKTY